MMKNTIRIHQYQYSKFVVNLKQTFTYDAIYRLIEAAGRETFNGQDDEDDTNAFTPYSVDFDTDNPNELTNYTQYYTYDKVGNILELNHVSGGANSYTRTYDYDSGTNRLAATTIINTLSYDYDARGNLLNLSNLSDMSWNALDQLSYIEKGSSLRAYYQYSGGNRIRKTIQKSSGETEQRIYLGNYEIYRKFDSSSLILKRETVHISDDTGRFAMLEHRLEGEDEAPEQLVRYIYSNHLQSATLELDGSGNVITYEEYHPYGTTSYNAKSNSINAVAKRYRYTGKERDEESGLYYHGARYYIPWLCRWSAVDPLESKYAGMSSYNYSFNNPVMFNDPSGEDPDDKKPTRDDILNHKDPNKVPNTDAVRNQKALISPKYSNAPMAPVTSLPETKSKVIKDGELTTADKKTKMSYQADFVQAQAERQRIYDYHDQVIMMDPYSETSIIGPRKQVQEAIGHNRSLYVDRLGEAVASGPIASGMYLIKGDRGAFQGEGIQNIAMSFSGVGSPMGRFEMPTNIRLNKSVIEIKPINVSATKETLMNEVSIHLKNGNFNFEGVRNMIPIGTANTFKPSLGGEKYNFKLNEFKVQLKWHTPEYAGAEAPLGSNSTLFQTAQISIGKSFLLQTGEFSRKYMDNKAHIPLSTYYLFSLPKN